MTHPYGGMIVGLDEAPCLDISTDRLVRREWLGGKLKEAVYLTVTKIGGVTQIPGHISYGSSTGAIIWTDSG